MIHGLSERLTSGGLPVLRLHYSADPDKRPGTAAGDTWIVEASQGYPGGTHSPRWRKEMEIDYGALGGTLVFPELEIWIPWLLRSYFEPVGFKLYASYDHGWRNPAAFHVHGIGPDGQTLTLWECYGSKIGVTYMSRIVKGEDVVVSDGRRFNGNPFAGKESFKIADPSIWNEDQPMADGTNKSVAELFRRNGVYFTKGERGGDTMVAEWLHGYFWQKPQEPLYMIVRPDGTKQKSADGHYWYSGYGAPCLLWEMQHLRHQDLSPQVALHKDQPEKILDKDNHAWDGLKMFLQRFPPKPAGQKLGRMPNTFDWWRRLARESVAGQSAGTFRV